MVPTNDSREPPGAPVPTAVVEALLTEFLIEYHADLEVRGEARPLLEYLARYRGAAEAIAREYLQLQAQPSLTRPAPPSLPPGEPAPHVADAAARYERLATLGVGGMGEVFLSRDRTLDRNVAIKFARRNSGALRTALLNEAMIAAKLSHPNIPPVHDLAVDAQGRPFYVMRHIQGDSLGTVLRRRADGASPYSLARLLVVFQQACLAIDYAHAQGVVHLDLKPDNIMVGGFGELYLMDWGLSARFLRSRGPRVPEGDPGFGRVAGSPGYMAPEQARGSPHLGPAADVFALGVILYEIVCGERAFPSEPRATFAERVDRADFVRGRAWDSAPSDLREICERALARKPQGRPNSAREVHDAVQTYLEGTRELERRQRAANAALGAADQHLDQFRTHTREAERLAIEVERTRPEAWETPTRKRASWKLEDQLDREREAAERAVEQATRSVAEALRHAPGDPEVRQRVGRHYWDCFVRAEARGDRFQQSFYEDQIRQLQLPELAEALRGDGRLELRCDPPADRILLSRYEERGRVLRPVAPRLLTGNPVVVDPLPMGRWHVRAERDGFEPLVGPVFMGRGRKLTLRWRFRTASEIGEGFVQIPPGPCLLGGDDNTMAALARYEPVVREFFMARWPVTVGEYVDFLQDLERDSPRGARARVPRVAEGGAPFTWLQVDGGIRLLRRRGGFQHRRWPVFGISWFDAVAYARWRSRRDGRRYQLASDEEWEKAARGTDGRRFPWGDHYDASFCKNLESTREKSQPEPIGGYRRDESPYGVRDLAGGTKDWCRDWFSEAQNQRLIRGGSWNSGEVGAHSAYRNGCPPTGVYPFLGFRLVHHGLRARPR
ncbi:MAG: bifunctional serine/threonine-protein kinase/formylglycine-generating enzyme family protein [Planctomycetota bacterium]